MFAFITTTADLAKSLIWGEMLANNKKCNVERHPAGDERKRVVLELLWNTEQSGATIVLDQISKLYYGC